MKNININGVQLKDLKGMWLSTNQIKGKSHCLKIGRDGNNEFAELSLLSPQEVFQTKKVSLSEATDSNTKHLIIGNDRFEIKHLQVSIKGIKTEFIEEITLKIRGQEIVFSLRNV